MSLPEHVRKGVEALQKGDPELAIAELEPVFYDPDLIAAEDLQDVRARIGSLLGQAWLLAGKPEKADKPLREAMRLAKSLSDDLGVAAIRKLQTQAVAELSERHQQAIEAQKLVALAEKSLEEILHGVDDVDTQLDRMLRKATAEMEAGRPESSAEVASKVLWIARPLGRVREQVLAHLALARAVPNKAEVELHRALEIATEASEFNLVGAVVKASEFAGIPLPQHPFAGKGAS